MQKCNKCGFMHYISDGCRKPKNNPPPHAVGSEANAKGSTVPSRADSSRDKAGANPAKLEVAAGGKSAAARKDVLTNGDRPVDAPASIKGPSAGSGLLQIGRGDVRGKQTAVAGTQDLPADTIQKPKHKDRHKPGYMADYLRKWRRGEVGNKYKKEMDR